jgi:hypothetical protein
MAVANYLLFRELAAAFFLLDLLAFLPYAHACLGPGYWKGTFLERPVARVVVYGVWALAALSLLLGVYPLVGALVLFPLFRRVYIKGRWNTLFRGGGAPGFMSHFSMLYILAFELARTFDPTLGLTHAVHTMFRVDFGVVLTCSGTYKSLSGYLKGEGMEYGLANPTWGYHWRFFKSVRPTNVLLRAQNTHAALSQVAMGLLLAFSPLYAPLGWIGGAMCTGAFFYLLFMVRLGRLAALMMSIPLLYFPDFGLSLTRGLGVARDVPVLALPAVAISVLAGLCWAYIVVLPFVKAMQYTNLFLNRKFPQPFQRLFTWYQNWVPIIMWRVFTPDVTNFFIRIRRVEPATGAVTPIADEQTGYSYFGGGGLRWKLRYLHVTESIAVTTVFTTLKYFQSKRELFEQKLSDYARSLGTGTFEFEYVAIEKGRDAFEFVPVARFSVETGAGRVEEQKLLPGFDYSAPASYSHIKETAGYGSYVPARKPAPS